jgi:hypothetical protein
MAEPHVSTQSITKRHWSLKVDNVSCMQRAKVGSQVCFFAHVGIPPTRSIGGHDGETTTVDRNRCTETRTFEGERGIDPQATAISLGNGA